MEELQAEVGDLLKVVARSAGISLSTLARRTKIPYQRLCRVLSGHRKPEPGELERVAAQLGVCVTPSAAGAEGGERR